MWIAPQVHDDVNDVDGSMWPGDISADNYVINYIHTNQARLDLVALDLNNANVWEFAVTQVGQCNIVVSIKMMSSCTLGNSWLSIYPVSTVRKTANPFYSHAGVCTANQECCFQQKSDSSFLIHADNIAMDHSYQMGAVTMTQLG